MKKTYILSIIFLFSVNFIFSQSRYTHPKNKQKKVVDKNSDAFDRAANKIDKKYSKDRKFDVAKMTGNKVNLSQTDLDDYIKKYGAKKVFNKGFRISKNKKIVMNN